MLNHSTKNQRPNRDPRLTNRLKVIPMGEWHYRLSMTTHTICGIRVLPMHTIRHAYMEVDLPRPLGSVPVGHMCLGTPISLRTHSRRKFNATRIESHVSLAICPNRILAHVGHADNLPREFLSVSMAPQKVYVTGCDFPS